jgi:methylglutaconyl-CoA hydratase
MKSTAAFTREENLREAQALADLFFTVYNSPKPVVARVHGAALGGGAGLVAASDIAVAALGSEFGFTEVRLGIVPAVISPYVISKIGESAARELFLTGERFEAVKAHEIGLVRWAVPEDDLDMTVERRVQELLLAGPRALAEAKALIREVAFRRVEDVQRYTSSASPSCALRPRGKRACARSWRSASRPGANNKDPDREPRRDRGARREELPRAGHRERRRLLGRGPGRAARARRGRGAAHRRARGKALVPGHRGADRRRPQVRRGRRAPRLRLPQPERRLRGRVCRGRARLHRTARRRAPPHGRQAGRAPADGVGGRAGGPGLRRRRAAGRGAAARGGTHRLARDDQALARRRRQGSADRARGRAVRPHRFRPRAGRRRRPSATSAWCWNGS